MTIVESQPIFWSGERSSFVLVTAPPPTPVPPPSDEVNVFEGCDEANKVCVGSPPGCIELEDCRLFGSVTFEDDKFYFELLSKRK